MDKQVSDKEMCIIMLNARIRDLRAIEEFLTRMKISFDSKTISNRIGGLKKCIDYIQKH